MVLLHHLPTNWIVSVSRRVMRSAIAPPVLMEWLKTSFGVKMTFGPVV